MIKTFAGLSLFTMASVSAFPVYAGDMSASENTNKTSTVDPSGPKPATSGARPASPGTVGAMNNTEAGSFTASKADQDKDLTKTTK